MGRPRTASVYENGPVRVVNGKNAYRIRWSEHGRERERVAKDLTVATNICDTEAARLVATAGGTISGGAAFGALADAWLERKALEIGTGQIANMRSVLYGHVLPHVGQKTCDRVTDTDLAMCIDRMRTAGYSAEWCNQAVRIVKQLCAWGVSRGAFPALLNPGATLKQRDTNSRLIDRALIPTREQIDAAAAAVAATAGEDAHQALRRRWIVEAARGTGLRWGELQALTPNDVDLAKRTVTVARAWHTRDGEFGAPKSRHAYRTVVIPVEDIPLWTAVVDITAPGDTLGQTLRGRAWNNANWNTRIWNPSIATVAGWPAGATFHYLRHYAITHWLDLGMPIGNVSALAGHGSTTITLERYVGASADHLDAARDLL